MLTKMTEIQFYTDCLIVEAVLADEKVIKKVADDGSVLSSMVNSVKGYFEQHIDPSNPKTSIMAMLVPGVIFTIFRSLGFTKLAFLFGMLTSVFNINVKNILQSICNSITSIISGNKKITSTEVTNIVTNAVNSNTQSPLATPSTTSTTEVGGLTSILETKPKATSTSKKELSQLITEPDELPEWTSESRLGEPEYVNPVEALRRMQQEDRKYRPAPAPPKPAETKPDSTTGSSPDTGSSDEDDSGEGGDYGGLKDPFKTTTPAEPGQPDYTKPSPSSTPSSTPSSEKSEDDSDKSGSGDADGFPPDPFGNLPPPQPGEVDYRNKTSSVMIFPRDVYLFKLSMMPKYELIKNADLLKRKPKGSFSFFDDADDALEKQGKGKGILIRVLSWFFSIMLSAGGFLVVGDVVNKFLQRPTALDGSLKDEMQSSSGASPVPAPTQTKFSLNPQYNEENYNFGSNLWTISATANEDSIRRMLIKFAQDVYQGLENKDQAIMSSVKFNNLVDSLVAANARNLNTNIILIPKQFHSKKQLADYFIDDVAKLA